MYGLFLISHATKLTNQVTFKSYILKKGEIFLKTVSARETLGIISKQWCSSQDFSILSNTGKNTTLKLMKDLRNKLEQANYFLPSNLLPMDKVVEYLNINIPYLKKVSNLSELDTSSKGASSNENNS